LPAIIALAIVEERGSNSILETLLNDTSLIGMMDISIDPTLKPLLNRIAQIGVEEHSYIGLETLLNNIPLVSYSVVRGLHLVDSTKTNILALDTSTN
jgi:hypothetical protein